MTQPISPVNEEEIEGEIEKEHKIFFELGKQLKEIIAQTLSENVVTSNKDIEKIIKSNVEDIKRLVDIYLTMLQNHAEEYRFWGWIEANKHLLYLTHLNAGLKIYTALTGNNAAQARQKLGELENEVYKTINLMYTLIISEKDGRTKTIENIINSIIKGYANRAINNIDTIFCKLENVKTEDEVIKMLLSRVIEEAKKFKEELEKIKSEKVEVTSVDDIVAFMKKFSKILEQGALAAMWTELIYAESEEFYEELNIQYLIDKAYESMMFVIEALRSEEIAHFEEDNE